MTTMAVARNEKADIQIEEQAIQCNAMPGVSVALSCSVPYDEVRDLVENSRAPRKPNRNRPLNREAGGTGLDSALLEELDRAGTPPSDEWLRDKSWTDYDR